MKTIDIYIKCLVLRFREVDKTINSTDLVDKILNFPNIEETKVMGEESEDLDNFKEFLSIYNKEPKRYTLKTLSDSIRVKLKSLTDYANITINMLKDENYKQEDVESLRDDLYRYILKKEAILFLSRAMSNLKADKPVDVETITKNLKAIGDKKLGEDTSVPLELDNEEAVQIVAQRSVDLNNSDTRIKSAFKGMNKALDGGFRKGEFVMIGALRYNYKSGILRTLFLQFAFNNKPIMKDESKKPLLLYVGFEDTEEASLKFCYDYLYCNQYGEAPKKEVTSQEIRSFLIEKMRNSPYKCVMVRPNPANYSLRKLVSLVDKYLDMGYEVHACCIDYLSKIVDGSSNGMGATLESRLKQLYQECYEELSKKRGVLTITAHQLSSTSRDVAVSGADPKDFVKNLPARGFTENCRSLDQIVDIEMYCHVHREISSNKAYLTFQVGKHRLSPTTPEKDKYFMVPFISNGTLIEKDDNPDGQFSDEDFDI